MKRQLQATLDAIPDLLFEVGSDVAEVCASAISEANEKGYSVGKQYELQLPHGKFWFELFVSRKPLDNIRELHFLFLVRDITERKQAEEQIHDMAFYDPLTKLPNRSLLNNRMDQAMAASNRSGAAHQQLCARGGYGRAFWR